MYQFASYTNVGGREENEDAIAVKQAGKGGLCALVADGLGGHGGGAIASRTVADCISTRWSGELNGKEIERLVREAHEAVRKRQTHAEPMKSTLAALFCLGDRIQFTYVGDTRLYHFYNDVLVFQTLDHSVSQIAVTLGEITPDEIRFHADRNRILRALGQEGELPVDVRAELLPPGRHAFLLCSDGFWEYVLESEMQQDLLAARSPEQWLQAMREKLLRRASGGNDNNSAVAVWATITNP